MDAPRLLTRFGLLRLGAAGAVLAGLVPGRARSARSIAPSLEGIAVESRAPFAGDRRMLATVRPGATGADRATTRFLLDRAATVTVEAVQVGQAGARVVWHATARLRPGRHRFVWKPAPNVKPGTYVLRLTLEGAGRTRVYGNRRPAAPERVRAPVVRVLGLEAAFAERSYAPGEQAKLTIEADAGSLILELFRSGLENENTDRADEMKGVPVEVPRHLDWRSFRHRPGAVTLPVGDWPSGLYFARLTAADGRVGFAPFIVRPKAFGATSRVAVVLPTNTWQAYNFRDADGDGWGDTWYAGGSPPVRLDRPYLNRGVPPRFRRYDLPFLRWLHWTGKTPDLLSDEDLGRFSGDGLRATYDLIVFPGHSEYVTEHAYNVVERFRDLGGRLIFLSANNFFWKVERRGASIRRVALWRDLNRPEARLIGTQYRANDNGQRQGVYSVADGAQAPWLWAGTGIGPGSTLGQYVGGYGIEIDARTADSPPETQVLATIPDLFGPGLSAEMTYYETAAGARVFSAGTLDFSGSVTTWPVRRMLGNLWTHMTGAGDV